MGQLFLYGLFAIMHGNVSQFSLSPTSLGLSFTSLTLSYGVVLVLLSWMSKIIHLPPFWIICCTGLLAQCVAMLMLGPVFSLLPTPSYPWVIGWLVVVGCGVAAVVIATFAGCQAAARDAGHEEGVVTYSLVSGLLYSALALGGITGSLIGGFLYDRFGFQGGFMVHMVLALAGLVCMCIMQWTYGVGQRQLQAAPRESSSLIEEETRN